MRSPVLALTWEYSRSSRWLLFQFFGIMLALPAVVYGVMLLEGTVPGRSEQPLIDVHYAMIVIALLAAVLGAVAGLGGPSRSYRLPVPSAVLVAARMLPSVLSAVVLWLLTAAIVNAAFDVDWPYLGPALFTGAVAAVAFVVWWGIWPWLPQQTALSMPMIAILMFAWFHARHGGSLWQGERADHLWQQVTGREWLVLIGTMAASYAAAVLLFARNRHNDLPQSWGGTSTTLPVPLRRAPFRSARSAQLWLEWRQTGWAVPAIAAGLIVAVPLFVAGISLFVDDRRFGKEEAGGIFGMLMGLMFGYPVAAAFLFALLQGEMRGKGRPALSTFRGMQPVTTSRLAAAVLQAGTISLVVTALLQAASVLIAFGLLALAYPSEADVHRGDWRPLLGIYSSTLLTSWTVMGLVVSGVMSGRKWVLVVPGLSIAGLVFLSILLGRYVIRPEAASIVGYVVAWIIGWACLDLTIWAYVAGVQRGLISFSTACLAGMVWFAACVATIAVWQSGLLLGPGEVPNVAQGLVRAYVLGLLALPLAPLATAPLALHWNRHR